MQLSPCFYSAIRHTKTPHKTGTTQTTPKIDVTQKTVIPGKTQEWRGISECCFKKASVAVKDAERPKKQ